ncbi:MAG: c-type cytochrome domain-containing protein [Gemmataceae bacterium]
MRFFHPLILVVLTTTAPVPAADPKPTPEALEFFEKHVRPVLVDKCVSCHGPKAQRGGLRMDSREAMLKGGDTGPALVVGDPQKSLIIQAVRRQGDLKMPPKDKVAGSEMNLRGG